LDWDWVYYCWVDEVEGVKGMGELFSLESLTEGYEDYWTLEWVGTSFRQAKEERDILLDKYNVYEIFRVTVWIDGKENAKFYFRGGKEIREGEI
jgi:hypothetical protein